MPSIPFVKKNGWYGGRIVVLKDNVLLPAVKEDIMRLPYIVRLLTMSSPE
jgi:hypothetical protein